MHRERWHCWCTMVGRFMGTVIYAAPEVLLKQGATTSSDVCSFGIVMWEMFTASQPFGHMPGMRAQSAHSFNAENTSEAMGALVSAITSKQLRPSIEHAEFPAEYLELLQRCWMDSPSARPSIDEVVCALAVMLQEDKLIQTVAQRKHEWEDIPSDHIEMGKQLGQGAQGDVMAALWNGNECAIKIFSGDAHAFHTELNVMHRLRHPNIVTFFGTTIENDTRCLVLERCASSVYAQLKTYRHLTSQEGHAKLNLATRVRYALDASKGMVFLHQHRIVHHDLKSSNLLIASDRGKTVKICDFSLSNVEYTSQSATKEPDIVGETVGTPGWMSPEELTGGQITNKSDVYSFGVVLWELLHSARPFEEMLFDRVSHQRFNLG